jgi:hypothetical protein
MGFPPWRNRSPKGVVIGARANDNAGALSGVPAFGAAALADDTRNGFQCHCGTGRRIAIYRKVALNDGPKPLRPPALRAVRPGGQAG